MTKMRTKTQAKALKLHDAVSHAASCLKEAGEPLHGLGPSQQYADAFARYGHALKELLAYQCTLHMADWRWNGYEGRFDFYWEFGAQLAQPEAHYEYDTRFMEARCPAMLDPQKPLDDELTRLRAEALHYNNLRRHMVLWAADQRKAAREGSS